MSAASNGGGWATIVFHEVCDQTLDPSNYQTCINSFHPIELSTLNNFLDWLDNVGQPSGPPAGVSLELMNQVVPPTPDGSAPSTTITCNGSACQGTYNADVSVTLSANDRGGSGVDKTYYTTDGSTPTTSSSVYSGAFTVSSDTTVKFFSTDHAGNTEAVNAQQIKVDRPPQARRSPATARRARARTTPTSRSR